MKVILTTKNFKTNNYLKETVEKKFDKLSKYFAEDVTANVMISQERNLEKVEATINLKGTIFRAEEATEDVYESIDKIIEKLSTQMSRFKTKLQKKHKDNKAVMFDAVPEYDLPEEEIKVVRTKKFELVPMSVDEAIVQMELLQHNFFVFLNEETDSVNIVYSRKDGNYGLLETAY